MDIQYKRANAGNYGGTRKATDIKYIVIHYTGNDGDTAKNNADYYAREVIKTSAHYFVDATTIYQSVDDLRIAYSVGNKKYASCSSTGGGKFFGKCKNANSISIELCDVVKNGKLEPNQATVQRALELTRYLMDKYYIPAENVIRHFDVSGKLCPAYWSGKENEGAWESEFHSKLTQPDYRAQVKKRFGFEDVTIDYLANYKYGNELLRKLATAK